MIGRRPAILLLASFATIVVLAVVAAGRTLGYGRTAHDRTVGYGQIRFDGLGPERWAARYHRARVELAELRGEVKELHKSLRLERQIVLTDPTVVEAINLSCIAYQGYCSTLWRKARCETGGTFDPHAANSSSGAVGLFQFLPSTWASTPYRVFSPFDPTAAALAAGWMHEQGRGGEWSCR